MPTIWVKGKVHGEVTEGELPADRVECPAIWKQDTTIFLHPGKNDFAGGSILGAEGDSTHIGKTRCRNDKA